MTEQVTKSPDDIITFEALLKLKKGMHVLVYRTFGWKYAQVQDVYIAHPEANAYSYVVFNNEVTPKGVHSMLTLTKWSNMKEYDGWDWRVRVVPDDEVAGKTFSYSSLN